MNIELKKRKTKTFQSSKLRRLKIKAKNGPATLIETLFVMIYCNVLKNIFNAGNELFIKCQCYDSNRLFAIYFNCSHDFLEFLLAK